MIPQVVEPYYAAKDMVNVNPYNALGYGLALLILFFFALIMYREWQKESRYNKERDKRVLEFMQAGFEQTSELRTIMEHNKSIIEVTGRNFAELNNRMDELLSRGERLINVIERKNNN